MEDSLRLLQNTEYSQFLTRCCWYVMLHLNCSGGRTSNSFSNGSRVVDGRTARLRLTVCGRPPLLLRRRRRRRAPLSVRASDALLSDNSWTPQTGENAGNVRRCSPALLLQSAEAIWMRSTLMHLWKVVDGYFFNRQCGRGSQQCTVH
jgi:hypothetical protein